MSIPTIQNALIIEEIGKPLRLVQRPVPTPPPGSVLVKIASAGINPHDGKGRDRGLFITPSLPHAIPTQDISGTVLSLGPNVSESSFTPGDRIFGQTDARAGPDQGGLQQYAILHSDYAAKIPESLSFDEAATIPVNAVASFVALFHESGLGLSVDLGIGGKDKAGDYADETILVIGGGSNTGKFGLQFAKLAGFGKVVTTAGVKDSQKVEGLESLGATHIIDRSVGDEEIERQIRDIVGDELIYILDAVNNGKDQNLGVSVLSNSKKGTLITLVRGEVDAKVAEKKKAGFRKAQALGISHMHEEFAKAFWKKYPVWIGEGKLKPLDYVVIEGLDADKVNAVMDEYRDGGAPRKAHVHPNEL
ncbi:GroES-like protein [Aspergillus crustosus]